MRFPAVRTLLIVLLLCMGAGCDRDAKAEDDAVELTIMFSPDSTGVWRELVGKFEREHPRVRVNLIEGPSATNTREDQYVTSFLSGQSPYDVIFADVPWIPKFAAGGWLEDLTDKWPEDRWNEFIPGSIEGSKYKGRIYRVPLFIDAGMLYYRTDLLQAAGEEPPETFAELVRIAQKLQSPHSGERLWGFVWQGQQYEGLVCDYLEILKGFGGDWIDTETNAVGLDQPPAIKAAEFLRDCIAEYGISPPGVTTYEEEQSRQLFHAGNAVFHRNWPYVWSLAQAEDSPIRGKVGIVRMPSAPGGEHAATLGGWGFAISSTTPHKDEAWAFVEFMTALPQARRVFEETGSLPALEAFYNDIDDPGIRQMYAVFKSTVPRPMTPQYAQASDILQRHLSAAISGATAPEEAMRGAATETRLLLPAK